MFEIGIFPLGILLLFVGLAFFLVTYLILRAVPKIRPISQIQRQLPISPDLPSHNNGVLMIRQGGRISYL